MISRHAFQENRLGIRHRYVLLKTYLLLLLIRGGLALLPFKQLLAWVMAGSHSKGESVSQPQGISANDVGVRRVVWAVERSSQLMPGGAKCLAKALTTYLLLGRRGYPPELRIGVAKSEAGALEAHAWVEVNGQVIMGNLPDLVRFTPLPSL
jgi:hypothetical protein